MTALEILSDQVGWVKECSAQGVPMSPVDAGQFDWALRNSKNLHPDNHRKITTKETEGGIEK